jgi:hypothetical protein
LYTVASGVLVSRELAPEAVVSSGHGLGAVPKVARLPNLPAAAGGAGDDSEQVSQPEAAPQLGVQVQVGAAQIDAARLRMA